MHVYYLTGMQEGQFRAEPVYIGIGTGEAYGPGPSHRSSQGRFRFFRYDIKDNFQYEHITHRVAREWTEEAVRELPPLTRIDENTATLLLARGEADAAHVLADPQVAEHYKCLIAANPHNRLIFRWIELRKVHEDLATTCCVPPAPAARLENALAFAEEIHRYFFVAWQHPSVSRLRRESGCTTANCRNFAAISTKLPDQTGISLPFMSGRRSDIPEVIFNGELRAAFNLAQPASERFENWLGQEVVKDFYAYGNRPELRLCSALVFLRLMMNNGLCDEAIRATYDRRLSYLDFSINRLTQSWH